MLAAVWIGVYLTDPASRRAFAAMAIVAVASDFLDGKLARRSGADGGSWRWLDPAADVVFVLAALGCASAAGAIPFYIPIMIAISFSQYALDSRLLHRANGPIRSRLGHYGGVVNYALVLALALSRQGSPARAAIEAAAPALALFYAAAIAERTLAYRSK